MDGRWGERFAMVALLVGAACGASESNPLGFLRIEQGQVAGLDNGAAVRVSGIHHLKGDAWNQKSTLVSPWEDKLRSFEIDEGFPGLDLAHVNVHCAWDAEKKELCIKQGAMLPLKGLWGVEWRLEDVPLDMNILVPGNSGLCLSRTSPGGTQVFDYPMSWEAQLVVLEGKGRGYYVWAEDDKGTFKRLTVERTAKGWQLGFVSMPLAPFEERSSCDSPPWRLGAYEGDWRVPAKRYRDWAETAFKPTRVEEQHPAWVPEIRCCVIMGLDLKTLEALPARLDPKQTLLYIPSWRTAGYDRDYPTYDQVYPTLDPFVQRAHELGFRVMLHVNYFGCDPLNPAYAEFEPYQIRSPWGSHEKDWWLWSRADPPIKFAYINPAYKPWRDLLVKRFSELCRTHAIDALHLDQTLCLYNDYRGAIDGMTMMDGSVALHRELREALPEVALSGEGLDEVTYRYEAFAQRHVWGMNHSEGTYSAAWLRCAHPISSYLLRPFTTIYGYLGCAPPTDGPLYSAWNEAYMHWGVIPTLKPDLAQLEHPAGFSRQFFDEAACWTDRRIGIDVDGPWPSEVAFPFKTADGTRAARMMDRRFVVGDATISQTVTGVSEIRTSGTIDAWRVYDDERILALDPGEWYPLLPSPRDAAAFHVASAFPEGFTVAAVSETDALAFVRTKTSSTHALHLAERLAGARCGSRPFHGQGCEVDGELNTADGAIFSSNGDAIYAHPPYRVEGTGVAYARIPLAIPADATRFASEVALDEGAVGEGKSDGVTFRVDATSGAETAHVEVMQASAARQLLELDLKRFAGKQAVLELAVDPGPEHNPSFDWARWYEPRIERAPERMASMTLVHPERWHWVCAGTSCVAVAPGQTTLNVEASFPGGVFLLRDAPPVATLPLHIEDAPYLTTFASESGVLLEAPQHAAAVRESSTVNGIERSGLFTHPPDHGVTMVDLPLTLPEQAARFHAYVGIRDGSKSTGMDFRVEVNGAKVVEEHVTPGDWHEISADLSAWAGRTVDFALVADSAGDYVCDWGQWGDPVIEGAGR